MSKSRTPYRSANQVRQSQVVTTFGPGSMMDLPDHAVIIGGLDDWIGVTEEITEPRLASSVCRILDVQQVRLCPPPAHVDHPRAPQTGIPAWQFPSWFITQAVVLSEGGAVRSRMLVHRRRLEKGNLFKGGDGKKQATVPVRFVRACLAGHVGDLDWYYFAHRGAVPCRQQLWIDERGTTGDIAEIFVRCECGAPPRRMIDASRPEQRTLGACDGSRPWLGTGNSEPCDQPNRLLVRSASNAYFPRVQRVISLPDRDEGLRRAIDAAWAYLEAAESPDDVRHERKKAAVRPALEGYGDDEVFREVMTRRGGGTAELRPVKEAELEVFLSCQVETGDDEAEGTFYARTLPRAVWDAPCTRKVACVVLVKRLREVVAQVGFTRFESDSPDEDGELRMGVKSGALSRDPTWVPAIENRGEGVFLGFDRGKIEGWLSKEDVKNRSRRLRKGFERWQAANPSQADREFPGVAYIMLHSLSHLLIQAVSLECGYPASSIRERVYAMPEVGYGILLYTGTPDAEGTLGGLVEAGRRIRQHLQRALDLGRLCSNDPVCAEHDPGGAVDHRSLAGAACHGCLLIGETSCEAFNRNLDRALVLPTVDDVGAAFFDDLV